MEVIFTWGFFLSTNKIIKPPTSKAIATVHELNNFSSILPANKAPIIMAGKTPIIAFNQRSKFQSFLKKKTKGFSLQSFLLSANNTFFLKK